MILRAHRYRFLIAGCPPAHKIADGRAATNRICQAVLGKADYQLGRTKVCTKCIGVLAPDIYNATYIGDMYRVGPWDLTPERERN